MTLTVGVTGTRAGMTPEQRVAVATLLRSCVELGYTQLRHGDCLGADAEFHAMARELGMHVIVHPPSQHKYRAWVQDAQEYLEEKSYLVRDMDIVCESDLLIGAPKQMENQQRGGTWYTLRQMEKRGKLLYICQPDGAVRTTVAVA